MQAPVAAVEVAAETEVQTARGVREVAEEVAVAVVVAVAVAVAEVTRAIGHNKRLSKREEIALCGLAATRKYYQFFIYNSTEYCFVSAGCVELL